MLNKKIEPPNHTTLINTKTAELWARSYVTIFGMQQCGNTEKKQFEIEGSQEKLDNLGKKSATLAI